MSLEQRRLEVKRSAAPFFCWFLLSSFFSCRAVAAEDGDNPGDHRETAGGKRYSWEFADGGFWPDWMTPIGANSEHLTPDPGGLLISLSSSPKSDQYAGSETRLKLGGDFDIFSEWDVVNLPTPVGGFGAGVSLAVDDGSRTWASLQRIRRSDGENVFVAHVARRMVDGEFHHEVQEIETDANSGRFELKRRGDRLQYLVGDDEQSEMRQIWETEFTDAEIQATRFAAQAGNISADVVVRLRRIAIDAAQIRLPEKPSVEQTVPPGLPFWISWSLFGVMLFGAWMLTHRDSPAGNRSIHSSGDVA